MSDGGVASTADAGDPPNASSAPLSLPMAADHDSRGNVYVVGFVAARGAANVSRFDEHARLMWNVDALDTLTYSSDAHVDVVAAPHGAVVVWRGIRAGKRTRVARYVGDDGKPDGTPFDIGSSACAVMDSLFSIGGKRGESVVSHHVPGGAAQTIVGLREGGDPRLVCAEGKRALLVEEGEEDLTARAIDDGKALPRVQLLGPDDLGDDDIREHEDFTIGDVLGELILTEQGHLLLREYGDAGVSVRRTLDHVVGADEDLMAVDGNARRIIALLSREASARCDGDIATDVVALDIAPGAKERSIDVAHGECGHDLGPYWVLPTRDEVYVAWAVRGPRRGPVEALTWGKLDEPPKSFPLSAEDVVLAGCGAEHCAFAVLARPSGTDGMVPGEARVLVIP